MKTYLSLAKAKQSQGGTLFSFVIVFPVFLLFTGILVDMSRAFMASYLISYTTDEGARVAANNANFQIGAQTANAKQQVESMVKFRLQRFINLKDIEVTAQAPQSNHCAYGTSQLMVAVETSAQFDFIFLRFVGFKSKKLNASTAAYYEWQLNQPPAVPGAPVPAVPTCA